MSIKMSRYVRIISSVSGANAVAQQKLVGRRFTVDPRVPVDKIVSVGPGGAEDYFGTQSAEAAFARQYFSYISPAPASAAPELQFAAYPALARPTRVYGARISASIEDFQMIESGYLWITNRISESVFGLPGANFSAVTSFAEVAQVATEHLQSNGGTIGAGVTYDAVQGSFLFSHPGVDLYAALPAAEPDDGRNLPPYSVDVFSLMRLAGPGVIISPGTAGMTPLEAFRTAEGVSDSFGSASFGVTVPLDKALPLAEYVAGENVKYQMYWPVRSGETEAWHAAMANSASNGLILNERVNEYKESLPMAIMAATDYDRTNATINYMFRQSGVTLRPDVTDDQMADLLDALRVNYYGQTANAGQRISFFQRGYLMGGVTAPLDMSVHANEQWLKARLKAQFMSLLLTTNRIPANNDGRGMVMAVLQGGVNMAVANGTILIGKTLTELQKVAITQASGDPLAWHDVENKGYWYDVTITESTDESGTGTYTAKYILLYAKGDSVRMVDGSHNLI